MISHSLAAALSLASLHPTLAVAPNAAPAMVTLVQYYPNRPVMPTLHPYVTPNFAGNRMANAYHANNQRFVNEHLRGCYRDAYGRYYGCQQ